MSSNTLCVASMAPASSAISKAKKVLVVAASVAATTLIVHAIPGDFTLPSAISSLFSKLSTFTDNITIVIEQSDARDNPNDVYTAFEAYLGSISAARRLRLSRLDSNNNTMLVPLDSATQILDSFEGIDFRWQFATRKSSLRDGQEARILELSFERRHKDFALRQYIPHVVGRHSNMRVGERPLKLHMLRYETWYSVDLDHPVRFDTLAIDPEVKRMVLADLERFKGSRDYYKRIGKPWRRGYLLHGPPGTGKSSLIAAMANYLKFDVFDLDLAEVADWTVLRTVIAATTNQSILVVENADRYIEDYADEDLAQEDRREGVTPEGVLSSIEGLWSGCSDERIIVFTAERDESFGPAVLRPGRMDVQVPMGYCTPAGFRMLARIYLDVDNHERFAKIETLLSEVDATPAEVAAEMMRGEVGEVMNSIIKILEDRRVDPLQHVL